MELKVTASQFLHGPTKRKPRISPFLKVMPLVASLLLGVSGCGKHDPKGYSDIAPGEEAMQFFKMYKEFRAEGEYNGGRAVVEVCYRPAPHWTKPNRLNSANEIAVYKEKLDCVLDCQEYKLYDYDLDLKPDRIHFKMRNGQSYFNILVKKADGYGDTTWFRKESFTESDYGKDQISDLEIQQIVADAEKEMKNIFYVLKIEKKLNGYRKPFASKHD